MRKDDSYLPTSRGDLPDLHTEIPPSTKTKTMCLATIYRASRNVREPGESVTFAELKQCLIHLIKLKHLSDSRNKDEPSLLELKGVLGAKSPPELACLEVTSDCNTDFPSGDVSVGLSSEHNSALMPECSTGVDIVWEDSANHMGSQMVFLQKKCVDYQWVRSHVWALALPNPS